MIPSIDDTKIPYKSQLQVVTTKSNKSYEQDQNYIESINNIFLLTSFDDFIQNIEQLIQQILQSEHINTYLMSQEFINTIAKSFNETTSEILAKLLNSIIYKANDLDKSVCFSIISICMNYLLDHQDMNCNVFLQIFRNIASIQDDIYDEVEDFLPFILDFITLRINIIEKMTNDEIKSIAFFVGLPCRKVDQLNEKYHVLLSNILLLLATHDISNYNIQKHTIHAATVFVINEETYQLLVDNSFLSFYVNNFMNFSQKLWGDICSYFGVCLNILPNNDIFSKFNSQILIEKLIDNPNKKYIIGIFYFLNCVFQLQQENLSSWISAGLIEFSLRIYPVAPKFIKKSISVLFVNIILNGQPEIVNEILNTPILQYIFEYFEFSKTKLRIQIYNMIKYIIKSQKFDSIDFNLILESVMPIAIEDLNSENIEIAELAQSIAEMDDFYE